MMIVKEREETARTPASKSLYKFQSDTVLALLKNPSKHIVVAGVGCFAKGTPVRMADGSTKQIDKIKSGDKVWAYDENKQITKIGEVSSVFRVDQNPKPMIEFTYNGETIRSTYDHPYFNGEGYYPLYQLIWGALETSQRAQLKLLCKQYGQAFDYKAIRCKHCSSNEASQGQGWALQDYDGWANRESAQNSSGELARKSQQLAMCEPYQFKSERQSSGEPGVVHMEIQCVVGILNRENRSSKRSNAQQIVEGRQAVCERSLSSFDKKYGAYEGGESGESGVLRPNATTIPRHIKGDIERLGLSRVKIMEAEPYYAISLKRAPYTYFVGDRYCFVVHNTGKTAIAMVWAQTVCEIKKLHKVLVITTASKSKTKDAEGRNDFELEADDFRGRWFRRSLDAFETVSWNSLHKWVDAHRRDLKEWVIVADECLAGDTKVETANGDKEIADLKLGDKVLSYNHSKGSLEYKKITRLIKKKAPQKMYRLSLSDGTAIISTGNHPHYTSDGYKPAENIKKGDILYELRNMRKRDCSKEQISKVQYKETGERGEKNLLFSKLCESSQREGWPGALHKEIRRVPCVWVVREEESCRGMDSIPKAKASKWAGVLLRQWRMRFGGSKRKTKHAYESKQPSERQANTEKSARNKKGKRMATRMGEASRTKRRQWQIQPTTTGALQSVEQSEQRMGNGTAGLIRQEATGISKQLQARHRKRLLQNRDRVRRGEPSFEGNKSKRQEEREEIRGVRVENIEILKLRDIKKLGLYRDPDFVYCIDVEDNHNFFANGVLTHNCQRAKGWTTGMGKSFLKITKETDNWVGFTGTPGDYWISYGAYFQACGLVSNKTHYLQRFCIVQTFKGFPEIAGYREEETLKKWWAEISYAPDTSKITQELPKATHKVVYFPKPKGYDKVLKMRQKLCEDGTLSEDYDDFLDNPSKTFHYLRQLCFTKEKEQWISDFLEGLGENCIIFYNYTATADAIEAIAKKVLPKGAKVWRIDGSHHQIPTKDTIGKYDIVLSQWQSGSEGLNLFFLRVWVSVELTYAYSLAVQARGRILRKGQTKNCLYYYLQTEDTVEGDIMECLKNKSDFAVKTWLLGKGLSNGKRAD